MQTTKKRIYATIRIDYDIYPNCKMSDQEAAAYAADMITERINTSTIDSGVRIACANISNVEPLNVD